MSNLVGIQADGGKIFNQRPYDRNGVDAVARQARYRSIKIGKCVPINFNVKSLIFSSIRTASFYGHCRQYSRRRRKTRQADLLRSSGQIRLLLQAPCHF